MDAAQPHDLLKTSVSNNLAKVVIKTSTFIPTNYFITYSAELEQLNHHIQG